MNFIKTNATEKIKELRSILYEKLTAPIDAMWELLYIASSQHYFIEIDNEIVGYCCINDDRSLVQIFLEKKEFIQEAIGSLIESRMIISASLSSSEPISFNYCLLLSKSIKTNTICFQHTNRKFEIERSLELELVEVEDIPTVKLFLKEQLGMDDTFGYTENLVDRKEIYLLRRDNIVIATSECRLSETQENIADLGIIVHRDYQGKGIATKIMKMQVNRVLDLGRKPICSTTLENVASRKAIEKAGFYSTNIIIDMIFLGNDLNTK